MDTLATNILQMTQSNATKTENLENDFEELSKKKRLWALVWFCDKDNPRAWIAKTSVSVFQKSGSQRTERVIKGISEGCGGIFLPRSEEGLCGLVLSLVDRPRMTNGQSRRSVMVYG